MKHDNAGAMFETDNLSCILAESVLDIHICKEFDEKRLIWYEYFLLMPKLLVNGLFFWCAKTGVGNVVTSSPGL